MNNQNNNEDKNNNNDNKDIELKQDNLGLEESDDFLKIFKALSDMTRLRRTIMLRVKLMCFYEIRKVIDSSMSTISKRIKEANFVTFNAEQIIL